MHAWVCMYACLGVCVCMLGCVCVCMLGDVCVCMLECVCMHAWVCMHACLGVYVCMSGCTCTSAFAKLCLLVRVRVFVLITVSGRGLGRAGSLRCNMFCRIGKGPLGVFEGEGWLPPSLSSSQRRASTNGPCKQRLFVRCACVYPHGAQGSWQRCPVLRCGVRSHWGSWVCRRAEPILVC